MKLRILDGGEIFALPSTRWAGHHFIHVNQDRVSEYIMPNMPHNTPWYKLLFYKGSVNEVINQMQK